MTRSCWAVLAATQVLAPGDGHLRPRAALDSLTAVRAARAALAGRGRRRAGFQVLAFVRDSAGVVVSLAHVCPPPSACLGGGGRVRVSPAGRAVVIQRSR